ncbi:lipopolysaccharide heptosyltransferase family protein [Alteromonas sp. BL110]|uniref:glycosyltransferase family 9 protein n=1 Tax=Alteromonas sp. BL110 TaxID=1714845 RepID=UPI000E4BF5B4|nr:glycosyltransferase family 9 protein [Alteromonas sp. BL110]AXT38480.1 lipopolysaccharide heptosyltransferase family protein [Alteromonas sp. BL110]RKM83775.1 lipopolysaccharide heptosyltransferase family protein [Alteromonas sp. BL110]
MRLSAIGDVCHAVAMVTRIQSQWSDAEITWVIGKVEYQLVKLMPNVRFIIFDKSKGKAAVESLKAQVAGETFDALLMMQVALRANFASRVIKAKQRIGFDWARSKELHWLFANKRVAATEHAHVLKGFMDFADALGVPESKPVSWDIPVASEDAKWGEEQAKTLGKYVVISPAASKAERNWLPQRYASIADYIQEAGVTVILCGGPGELDRKTADAIKARVKYPLKDFTGQTTLHQLLMLLKHAHLVIAPDTGPAHMATTVSTPVIGLYAHSNPRRTGPYNNLDRLVSVYDECIEEQKGKPWSALPWGTRAKGSQLMEKITVDMVKQKVAPFLA